MAQHEGKRGECSHCSATKKECKDEGRRYGGACCNRCFAANGKGGGN